MIRGNDQIGIREALKGETRGKVVGHEAKTVLLDRV